MAALALLPSMPAMAEPGAWSGEPVRIVVTFPPGGTSDLVARLLAQHLDTEFGQKAVVDNRPGAAGTVAADYVAQQAPDGTTLILSNNAPFTIAPTRFKSLPYDPLDGFTHIAYIGASAPGLFVQPSAGIGTLDEYIARVKETPMTYGSSGVGSISHILGEAVDAELDVEFDPCALSGKFSRHSGLPRRRSRQFLRHGRAEQRHDRRQGGGRSRHRVA